MIDIINRNKAFIGIILATIVLLFGGIFLFTKDSGNTNSQNIKVDTSRLVSSNSLKTSGIFNGEYLQASASATTTLVEFGDYECPACAIYSPMVQRLLTDFSGKITYVFRNYPLPQHKNATLSAYAVQAAGLQGKYWQLHDKMFATQNDWAKLDNPKDTFISYAKEIGVDVEQFKKDIDSPLVKDLVQQDINDGNAIGLTQTPTFYLNDLKISLTGDYDQAKRLIQLIIPSSPAN